MGSSMKTSNSHNQSSQSHRGKPYGLMLLLAFGAAILGVMVLHKLREKRIFGLLVQEKDHELLSLHLLYKREKEFNKEARKKIEDMKTKVYSLRSQKLEADRKLIEMESTISSLRDERKVIESALEEKKNEIKRLTQGRMMNSSSEEVILQEVAALKEMIKLKEAENADLKLRLQKPAANVESASTETIATGSRTREERENDIVEQKTANSTSKQGYVILEEKTNESRSISNERKRATMDDVSDTVQEQGSQGYRSIHRGGGLKWENSDGSEQDSSHRLRRSKGNKWREIGKNRRLGYSLYPATTTTTNGAEALSSNNASVESTGVETKQEEARIDQMATSDKENRTQETTSEIQSRDIGKAQNTEESSNVRAKTVSTEEDDARNQLKDQESGNVEKMMHSVVDDENKKRDDEQENGIEREEAKAEDLDDGEPEIDRDDIKRLSESDQDEESEATEF